MKKAIPIFLFAGLNALGLFAQTIDTAYYGRSHHIYSVLKRTDTLIKYTTKIPKRDAQLLHLDTTERVSYTKSSKWEVQCFYEDGHIMGTSTSLHSSELKPIKRTTIYFENGKIQKMFDADSGIMRTYNENGNLISLTIERPADTILTVTDYYDNGTIHKLHKERKNRFENPMALSFGGERLMVMWQVNGYPLIIEQFFYPNGKLYSSSRMGYIDKIPTPVITYYNENGTIDTASKTIASYSSRGYFNHFEKQGKRLQFYSNGHLQSIEHFEKDMSVGVNEFYYENGRLQSVKSYGKNGAWDEIAYFDNGLPKEENHYDGQNYFGPSVRFGRTQKLEHIGSAQSGNSSYIGFDFDTLGHIAQVFLESSSNRKLPVIDKTTLHNYSITVKGKINNPTDVECTYLNNRSFFTMHIDSLRLNGPLIVYDSAGRVMLNCTFKKGYLYGNYLVMDKGDTMEFATMDKSRFTGRRIMFSQYTHKLMAIDNYNDSGKRTLAYSRYNPNGTFSEKTEYLDKNTVKQTKNDNRGNTEWINISHLTAPYAYTTTNYYPDGKISEIQTGFTDKEKLRHLVIKEYYENGNLKKDGSYIDNKGDGTYKEYYEDGKLKKESHFIKGKINGNSITYSDSGKVTSEYTFKKGTLEKIEGSKINRKDSCYCDFTTKTPYNFLNAFTSFISFDTLQFNGLFVLDSNIRHTFFKYINTGIILDGDIVTYRKLHVYIPGNKNATLNFTPCHRPWSQYEIGASICTDIRRGLSVTIHNAIFSVDVSHKALLPVDNKGNSPKDTNNSDFIFTAKELAYAPTPFEGIQSEGLIQKQNCAHWFKVGNSELYIMPDLYGINLDTDEFRASYNYYDYTLKRIQHKEIIVDSNYPFHVKNTNTTGPLPFYVEDHFLREYMGLVIKTGFVKLEVGKKKTITGKLEDMLVASNEMDGVFTFSAKDFPAGYNSDNLKADLTKMGYQIQLDDKTNKTHPDAVRIYFSYGL